jgi:hypothetical protein
VPIRCPRRALARDDDRLELCAVTVPDEARESQHLAAVVGDPETPCPERVEVAVESRGWIVAADRGVLVQVPVRLDELEPQRAARFAVGVAVPADAHAPTLRVLD